MRYVLPILAIMAFAVILNGGHLFKQPKGGEDDVSHYLTLVREDLQNGDWSQAAQNAEKLTNAWLKVLPRVQYSVDRDDVTNLSRVLHRLEGSLADEDRSGAMADLREAEFLWEDLGR